jgi:hypothetical protein
MARQLTQDDSSMTTTLAVADGTASSPGHDSVSRITGDEMDQADLAGVLSLEVGLLRGR